MTIPYWRRWFVAAAVLFGLIVAAAVTPSADATHVTEPDKPFVEMHLRVNLYPHFRATTITTDPELTARWAPFNILQPGTGECAGLTRYNWDRIRLEADLLFEGNPLDPSVHWKVSHEVSGPVIETRTNPRTGQTFTVKVQKQLWDDLWAHANSRPHAGNRVEIVQANHYRMKDVAPSGVYTWRVKVTNDITGEQLERSISWCVPDEPEDPSPSGDPGPDPAP